MNLKTTIFIIVLSVSLTACFGLYDSDSDTIIGDYEVLWVDNLANQTISHRVTPRSSYQIVPPYVFSIGHDQNFIIAKQHPTDGFEGDYKIDKSIINYYVIQMRKKDKSVYEQSWGPLTLYQFDSLCIKLNIEDIEFTMNFPEQP